jgi:hypothetical protein
MPIPHDFPEIFETEILFNDKLKKSPISATTGDFFKRRQWAKFQTQKPVKSWRDGHV